MSCVCCADQNAHLPGRLKRFINPNIGSQLLRFAVQRSVGSLEVAHRVWDVLLQQRSRASRVAMRAYLIALQRRDPDNPRMQEVQDPSSLHILHNMTLCETFIYSQGIRCLHAGYPLQSSYLNFAITG